MSKLKADYSIFTEDVYMSLFLEDKPFLFRNFVKNPECLATWEDVEYCCNNGWNPGYTMHPDDGKVIADGSEWVFHRETKDRFDALHNNGAVCLLNYGEYSEETNELMGFFEDKFNVNAKAFIQAHLVGINGYGLHCDARETMGIFILQIEGNSEWKVYNNRLSSLFDTEHPLHRKFVSNYENGELKDLFDNKMNLILEDVLRPGDLLYIPHRMYHHAVSKSRRISLSIPCFIREPNAKPNVDRRYYRLNL